MKLLSPSMRQRHVAGEKLFVDYSGVRMEVTDPVTGTRRPVELFVAVLGASNYTYAEASCSQTLPDWIGVHVRAFEFFGGMPALIVSDNLKSAVVRACFHEPGVRKARPTRKSVAARGRSGSNCLCVASGCSGRWSPPGYPTVAAGSRFAGSHGPGCVPRARHRKQQPPRCP